MKKTKLLVLGIILSLAYARTAYAELPDKTLIIGNKAYSISDTNIPYITQDVYNNPSCIYYKDNGNIVDIFTEQTIGKEDSIISSTGSKITYYDANNLGQIYAYDNVNKEFKTTTNNTEAFVNVTVQSNRITDDFYIATVTLGKFVGISGQTYYQVGNSSRALIANTITVPYTKNQNQLNLLVYPNDQNASVPIATGYMPLPTVDSTTGKGKGEYPISLSTNSTGNVTQYYIGQGNMTNGGYVNGDSRYIYYGNTSDLGKIYKTSIDGLENYIICEDNAKYIFLNGDWLYYSNYSDGGKLYKVKTDGTGRRKVSDNVASYINVKDDKVYYCNGSDKNKIYSIDDTGVSHPLCSDEASYLTLSNECLYYSNISDSGKLYRIALDGSSKRKVYNSMDSIVKFVNSSPNLSGNYFVTSDGKLYRGLDNIPVRYSKVDKNGVSSAPVDDKVLDINVVGSTVYYKSGLDGGKLYKVDSSSGGVGEKVAEDSVDAINVYAPDLSDNSKDVVYYIKSGTGKLYKVLDPIIKVGTNGVQTKTLVSKILDKLKQTDKVTKVDNITTYCDNDDVGKTLSQINVYKYFPDKVSATFSDNTVRQVIVSWDTTKITFKNGVYTIPGNIVGYNKSITLTLVMASDFGISPNDINIINVVGSKNDSVTVDAGKGLASGDILKVYDPDTNKVIGSGTAASDGSVDIERLDLKSEGGTLLFTVTKKGQAESRQISKTYGKEMPKAPTGVGIDLEKVTDDTAENNKDGFTIKPNDLFGSSIGDNNIDDLEFIIGNYDTKKSSVVNWSSTWISCNSTDSIQIPKSGIQIKVRTKEDTTSKTPASVATNPIVIQPRASAPIGIDFNEKDGIINNAATTMEYTNYSSDGTTSWAACSSASIQGVTYPLDKPIKVRYSATKNSLPSLEDIQIKINAIASATDATTSNNYAVSEDAKYLYLKAPVPVTWSVTETNGNATTKATVTQSTLMPDSNGNTVYVTKVQGLENGVARVVGTDAAGQKGYVDILMSNQSQITVANDAEFNNALPRTDIKTIVLKPYIYNINPIDLGKLGKDLTIKGQGNNCQMNMATVASGNFINTNGQKLTLQNLVIDGNGLDVENAINADASTNLNGITFRNIKNSDISKVSTAVNFNSGSDDLTVDKSTFDGTNTMNGAIVIGQNVGGNVKIANSSFSAMQKASKQQAAYIQNSTYAKTMIKGNNINNYNNFNNNDMAIKLNAGGDITIGGTDKSEWNTITGCAKGIVFKPTVTVDQTTIKNQNYFNGIKSSDGKVYDFYEDNVYGAALGQLVETTKGVVANLGTPQQVQIKVKSGCTTAEKVTILGQSIDVTPGDAAAVALQIKNGISLPWTAEYVTSDITNTTLMLTASIPAENVTASATGGTTGVTFAVSNTTPGVAPTAAVSEVDTLTIASGADADGSGNSIKINISDGTNTASPIYVTLDGTTTIPSGLAAKIADAIKNANVTFDGVNYYTAAQGTGNDANKVIITQAGSYGKDVNLTISLTQ